MRITGNLLLAVKTQSIHCTLAITQEMPATLYHTVIMLNLALMMKTMIWSALVTALAHIAEDGGTKAATAFRGS